MKSSALKKHSFWFLFGAVPLLVGLGVLMILSSVGTATDARLKEYLTQKDEIAKAQPKGQGLGVALSKQKGDLDSKVTALWGENYLQQKRANLYKWPTTPKADSDLAKLEQRDMPYGSDFLQPAEKDAPAGTPPTSYLDPQQSELIEFAGANVYLKAFRDMAEKVAPTRFGSGGPAAAAGGMGEGGRGMPGPGMPGMPGGGPSGAGGDGWQAVLRHVTEWGTTNKPTIPELWLALEDIWVQRELLGIVARTNTALTKFEPEFSFWNHSPLKRTFTSRLWSISLEVVTDANQKYLKATIHNPTPRLQLLGANKVMRLKVWLDDPKDPQPSLSEYVIGGELVPGYATMDVPLQKTDPRDRTRPGSHAIPLDRAISRISKVEQILDDVSVPVKLIQAIELGMTDHRRGTATLVAPKLKGLPAEPEAATDPNAAGGGQEGGYPGGSPGVAGAGMPGPGGMPGMAGPGMGGGAAAAGARSGPKESVLLGNMLRYLEVTDQVRRMPVALTVVLDLAFEQDLLVHFTNSPMRFHITQTGWQRFRGTLPKTTNQLVGGGGVGGVPGGPGGRPGMPGAGMPGAGMPGAGMPGAGMPGAGMPGAGDGESGMPGASSATVTAQANAGLVTLAVYGVVSLYNELPVYQVSLYEGETFEAGTNWKEPSKVSTVAELQKLLPDPANQAKVKEAIDFRTHDLLAFAWEGPADDKLTFTLNDQTAKFGLAPGSATEKAQHRKLFAVRRTVTWTAE